MTTTRTLERFMIFNGSRPLFTERAMNKIIARAAGFAAFVAFGAICGTAGAADMPVKAPPPSPPPPPTFSWTGWYVGIGGGGTWARDNGDFVLPPPATWENKISSGIFSPFIGAQQQIGSIVIGAEGSVAFLSFGTSNGSLCSPTTSCTPPTTTLETRLNDPIYAGGGRLGWAAGMWMPYVDGGYAETQIIHQFGVSQSTNDQNGWYVGGGVDWAASSNVILGIDYRHYDFGSLTVVPVSNVTGVGIPANTWTNRTTMDAVMVRISFKSDPWIR